MPFAEHSGSWAHIDENLVVWENLRVCKATKSRWESLKIKSQTILSKDVPRYWSIFKETEDKKILDSLVKHNAYDVIRNLIADEIVVSLPDMKVVTAGLERFIEY